MKTLIPFLALLAVPAWGQVSNPQILNVVSADLPVCSNSTRQVISIMLHPNNSSNQVTVSGNGSQIYDGSEPTGVASVTYGGNSAGLATFACSNGSWWLSGPAYAD